MLKLCGAKSASFTEKQSEKLIQTIYAPTEKGESKNESGTD